MKRPAWMASTRLARSLPLAALLAFGCLPGAQGRPPPPKAPRSAATAEQILPADLDVVIWIDVTRIKELWLHEPERQLSSLLHEYGLLPPSGDSNDAVFWGDALRLAERAWIACRPHPSGCRDPVVLLRGNYRRIEPRRALSKTDPPLDLGGGWLRYDRTLVASRSTLSRLYYSPPDRLLAVSQTEIDAVERSLERSYDGPHQALTEAGLVSLQLRPRGIARVIEERSPAAARFLRDATALEVRVTPKHEQLEVLVDLSFETQDRAERAAEAFRLLQSAYAKTLHRKEPIESPIKSPVEVQANRLVMRLWLARPTPPADGTPAPRPPTERVSP